MTDDMDRQIDIELQRSQMQEALRDCQSAVMLTVTSKGELLHTYMNVTDIERRGMVELMGDTAPQFFPIEDEDND